MQVKNLRAGDWAILALLGAAAVEMAWECLRRDVSANALMLGAPALLLLIGLGGPWRFRQDSGRWKLGLLLLSPLGVLIGVATDTLLPVALAWSGILWAWLDARLETPTKPQVARLILLSLFVFPWVDLDLKPVSWLLRITAAAAAETALNYAGMDVDREGAVVYISGQPVEVNDHCAGRETLHAMLVVGLAAAQVYLGSGQAIWPWLGVLPVLAWLANTLRVLLVCLTPVWFEDERYRGWLHDGGGWLVVGLMLGLCMLTLASWNRLLMFGKRRGAWLGLGRIARAAWAKAAQTWAGPAQIESDIPVGTPPGETTRRSGWRWNPFHRVPLQQTGLGLLLVTCLLVGSLWRLVPLDDAQSRLQQLAQTAGGQEVPLSESEQRRLGEAVAVKRLCRIAGRDFLVTAIDGTANRRAVHDPTYCWTVVESSDLPVNGGYARLLRARDEGTEKEVLFWFSDGSKRYSSPVQYLFQTSLRRITFGRFGQEPLLILVEPAAPTHVNWFRFLDGAEWLTSL